MEAQSLPEIVRKAETQYLAGTTTLGRYVNFSMHDTIETIDAYLNSQHTSGLEDSLGREKPFFNIVIAASNVWYRATDLDRKDIRIIPSQNDQLALAFVATVILQNWMRESRFGVFLNEWGRTLARYGSAVCKFVEQDGKLTATVVPWNRIITDAVDFDALPRIEKFYMTPEQLRLQSNYDQKMVDDLIENNLVTRKTLDYMNQDNQPNFVELYEVHGRMSQAVYKLGMGQEVNDGDEDIYFQQMHVISYIGQKEGEYKDWTLYCGKEAKDPYMLTHLIKEDGRTLSIGCVESLFDAQWMQNHTMKNMKDTLDLSSKLIFQTTDGSFAGRNALSAIETGDILTHTPGSEFGQVNTGKPDISALQAFGTQWGQLAQDLTATPDSIRGNNLPSGTPYSLAAFQGAQANSLFEMMTENKGLAVEDMMHEHILPFLEKRYLKTGEQILGILDDQEIDEIDAMYVPREAVRRYNDQFKKDVLRGVVPSPYDPQQVQGQVKQGMGELGNKRFFSPSEVGGKTWKDAFKDFDMKANVDVTNERTDKQAVLTTLSQLLQTIATNPLVLQDPTAKMLFARIVQETGVISPIQLTTRDQTPPAPPPGQQPAEPGPPMGVGAPLPVQTPAPAG